MWGSSCASETLVVSRMVNSSRTNLSAGILKSNSNLPDLIAETENTEDKSHAKVLLLVLKSFSDSSA